MSLDVASGAKYLKQLCLGDCVDFKPTHYCLRFINGDAGGVKVIVAGDIRSVISFYTRKQLLL